ELRRQADLGHEQQRLAAGIELLGDEAQEDLGLAAARDAVEQKGACTAFADRLERGTLIVRERRRLETRRRAARPSRAAFAIVAEPCGFGGDPALLLEPTEYRETDAGVAELADRRGAPREMRERVGLTRGLRAERSRILRPARFRQRDPPLVARCDGP